MAAAVGCEAVSDSQVASTVLLWGGGTGGDGTRSFCPHFGQRTFTPAVGCEPRVSQFGHLKLTTGRRLSASESPKAEAPLSRRLRTPPLPATHAAVGNSWQNRGLCQGMTRSTAVTSVTSCRTSAGFGPKPLPISDLLRSPLPRAAPFELLGLGTQSCRFQVASGAPDELLEVTLVSEDAPRENVRGHVV